MHQERLAMLEEKIRYPLALVSMTLLLLFFSAGGLAQEMLKLTRLRKQGVASAKVTLHLDQATANLV
jgi:hypothetical protein